jgi:hypothetical protein
MRIEIRLTPIAAATQINGSTIRPARENTLTPGIKNLSQLIGVEISKKPITHADGIVSTVKKTVTQINSFPFKCCFFKILNIPKNANPTITIPVYVMMSSRVPDFGSDDAAKRCK